jgi:hypothetical protein
VEQLIVSLKKERMLEAARDARAFDISELIGRVPSATIVSGDPSIAVQVEVDKRYVNQLRRSVDSICTVGYYRSFVPL